MTLYDRIVEILPNAEMAWAGAPDPDSAVVAIDDDNHIVVTHHNGDHYDVGIYTVGAWMEIRESSEWLVVDTADHVLELLDRLTEPPEGVDWAAWVLQWIAVARANGGLAEMGVVG